MFQEEIYISKEYKLEDYLRLRLKINSNKDIWESAINIFRDRIKSRYFDAIDNLSQDVMKYGFSIMVLECLLIDTFVKFRYGPNKDEWGRYKTEVIVDKKTQRFNKLRYNKENRDRFIRFLREFFILNGDSKRIAEKFYEDIRCSIVHFGSTENASRLTADATELLTVLENGDISVDIVMMKEELKKYFNTYIKEVKDKANGELRKNFMLAMDYLCGIYSNYENE